MSDATPQQTTVQTTISDHLAILEQEYIESLHVAQAQGHLAAYQDCLVRLHERVRAGELLSRFAMRRALAAAARETQREEGGSDGK